MSNEIAKKEPQTQVLAKLPQDNFLRDIIGEALAADIKMPENYAAENAIKSAYLIFVEENYFQTCKIESIINATLDMVVQGLSPVKEQCYFIKYGNILKCFRGYLGSIAVAKRLEPDVYKVNYACIYGGDELDIEVVKGIRFARNHKQKFENVRSDNIIGAYAIALNKDGVEIDCDIMTFNEIKESWKRSAKKDHKPILENGEVNPKSDHGKQPDRFSCRTVVNRLCKKLISVTDDEELLRAVRDTDEERSKLKILQEDVEENANKKVIDFKPDSPSNHVEKEEIIDAEPMATADHLNRIRAAQKTVNKTGNMMEDISGYIGRKIERIRELTAAEAESYIHALTADLEPEQPNTTERKKPDWS